MVCFYVCSDLCSLWTVSRRIGKHENKRRGSTSGKAHPWFVSSWQAWVWLPLEDQAVEDGEKRTQGSEFVGPGCSHADKSSELTPRIEVVCEYRLRMSSMVA